MKTSEPESPTTSAFLGDSLAVALGGALGTLTRQGMNTLLFLESFPLSTLLENISGAFLLGVLTGYLLLLPRLPHWLRTGLGVGFLGGYTTMSTLAADSFQLLLYQTPGLALLYVLLSLIVGLLAAALGLHLGKTFARRRLAPEKDHPSREASS